MNDFEKNMDNKAKVNLPDLALFHTFSTHNL